MIAGSAAPRSYYKCATRGCTAKKQARRVSAPSPSRPLTGQ